MKTQKISKVAPSDLCPCYQNSATPIQSREAYSGYMYIYIFKKCACFENYGLNVSNDAKLK